MTQNTNCVNVYKFIQECAIESILKEAESTLSDIRQLKIYNQTAST